MASVIDMAVASKLLNHPLSAGRGVQFGQITDDTLVLVLITECIPYLQGCVLLVQPVGKLFTTAILYLSVDLLHIRRFPSQCLYPFGDF